MQQLIIFNTMTNGIHFPGQQQLAVVSLWHYFLWTTSTKWFSGL